MSRNLKSISYIDSKFHQSLNISVKTFLIFEIWQLFILNFQNTKLRSAVILHYCNIDRTTHFLLQFFKNIGVKWINPHQLNVKTIFRIEYQLACLHKQDLSRTWFFLVSSTSLPIILEQRSIFAIEKYYKWHIYVIRFTF